MTETLQCFPYFFRTRTEEEFIIETYAITPDGQRICLIDKDFKPFCYVELTRGSNLDTLQKIIVEEFPSILPHLEFLQTKKILGLNEIDLIRVSTPSLEILKQFLSIVSKRQVVNAIYETDVFAIQKYLESKQITPNTLCEVEVEKSSENRKVPTFKLLKIKQLDTDIMKNAKLLAFDLETYNSGEGGIDFEENAILMSSFYSPTINEVVCWKRFNSSDLDLDVAFVNGEIELLEHINTVLDKEKPVFLIGYFSGGFDIPYIVARSRKYRLQTAWGLDNSPPRTKYTQASIVGIVHFDVFQFVKKIISPSLATDRMNLDSVADELLGEKKVPIKIEELAHAWDEAPEDLPRFAEYCLKDSKLVYELAEVFLPIVYEFSKICAMPLQQVVRAYPGNLAESYLIHQALSQNRIIPSLPSYDQIAARRADTFEGSFVQEPQPGVYKDVVVVDFKSLYPSVIVQHNISPETLNCECCKDAPSPSGSKISATWFCQKNKGFFPQIIEEIIQRRQRVLTILSKTTDVKRRKQLEARERALKLLANSVYGHLGFERARWYSKDSAKAVAELGRQYLTSLLNHVRDEGLEVLYADTDSVFIHTKEGDMNKVKEFLITENKRLPQPLELMIEGVYKKALFVPKAEGIAGAKKKYVLLDQNDRLVIRGFRAVSLNNKLFLSSSSEEVRKAL